MPFVAAAPALWGGIFAGSGAVGAAALAKKASDNANKTAQGIATQQNYTTNTLAQEAAMRSKPAYDKAYNYYSKMLEGDMSSLQPDIENAQQQFSQASRNLVNNAYARGGGLGRGLGQIEGQKAMTISDIMSRSRPQAASALAALASGDQQTALQALASAQQGKLGQQQLQQQAYSGIGSFITRLLSTPGLFNMFDKQQQPSLAATSPSMNPMVPAQIIPNYSWPTPLSQNAYPNAFGGFGFR